MAPLELFCRGGDPRAMKGFIAACLSGAEVKFTPMTAAVSGETRGAPIKLGELTDANAIARFLGNRGALKDAFVPSRGPERWAVERWTEWETNALAPAVALACAAKDAAPVVTMLRETLDVRLTEVGFGDENTKTFVSIAGGTASKTTRTLADVVVVAALFPLLGENRASGVRGVERLADEKTLVVSWFESFFDTGDELTRAQILSALELSKASVSASYTVAANDGAALLLRSLSSAPPTDPSKEKFCVTTAINYANGAPHMGHAYEAVSSDVIARYHRLYGRDVLFQTGSDEHGQKIAEAAAAAGHEAHVAGLRCRVMWGKPSAAKRKNAPGGPQQAPAGSAQQAHQQASNPGAFDPASMPLPFAPPASADARAAYPSTDPRALGSRGAEKE
mmetsp:Transcript_13108/g.55858  ORF Transcript_13108/g.55858 Transcript_13108/m.55858 type:complete len:393 (+) Transcript_13108:114-1292(+)